MAATRAFTPKYAKPVGSYCDACVLQTAGAGYVPAYAPTRTGAPASRVVLVGEAPWIDEAIFGEPMMGASGSMLKRVLDLIGRSREQHRIDNLCRCVVPGMNLAGFPRAVETCRYLDDALLTDPPAVVVPLGGAALQRILGLPRGKHITVENFHGTVTRDPTDQFWVVPTYHPSHLQRGATNLMGVVAFDLTRAWQVAEHGWPADPGTLIVDPPVPWFRAWADRYLAAARQDPYAFPLSVDIETPDKGADEGAILAQGEDLSYQILRVNVSCHPDEGVTVPFVEGYLDIVRDLCLVGGVQYYWFKGFDVPRLVAAQMPVRTDRAWDVMWMAKATQSDIPMGLGFHAPFHSTWGAWKHLSESAPGMYAAIDALQTRRVGDGYVADLVHTTQWPVFERHMHAFHRLVLQPATDLGMHVDRDRLLTFKAKLDVEAGRLLEAIADAVPPEWCPLTPKEGLSTPPSALDVHTQARAVTKRGAPKKVAPDPLKQALYARARVVERLVLRSILVCDTCGKQQVTRAHKCADRALTPQLETRIATVPRWYWQEPFNPDSPHQLLDYAKAKGHTPGKAKGTGHASMDRETLTRLVRETRDPVYRYTLDYRGVQKVRGTYVIGTEKRLDPEDRIHGTFTFKPSTMRLSGVNPNLQNVTADKGGKDSLAAGFRSCVTAQGRMVEAGSGWEDA